MAELSSLQLFKKVSPTAYSIRGTMLGKPKPQEPQTPVPLKAASTVAGQPSENSLPMAVDSVLQAIPDSLPAATDSLRIQADSLGVETDSVSVNPAGLDVPEIEPHAYSFPMENKSHGAAPGVSLNDIIGIKTKEEVES